MTQPSLPDGLRILGQAHAGVCGTWWRASTPDGGERLVLRIASPEPALAERLAAATAAVDALRHGGLLATAAPVRHNGALWLVAGRVPGPTLSELAEADGTGPDAGAVATVATETARTLAALHAAGSGHGAVHGRTVCVSGIGAVTLTETGLLPGMHGVPADPAVDRRAWAELLRWMVARWCGTAPEAGLLLRCATLGEEDLAGAVRELRDGPLPVGAGARTALVAAVAAYQQWSATADARTVTAAPPAQWPPTAQPLPDWATPATPTTYGAPPTEAMTFAAPPTEAFTYDTAPTEAATTSTPTGRPGEEHTTALPSDEPTTALSMSAPVDPFLSTRVPTMLPEPEAAAYHGQGWETTGPQPTATAAPTTATGRTATTRPPAGAVPPTGRYEYPGAVSGRYEPTGTSSAPAGEVRFGPGVPATPPTAPAWHRPPPPPAQSRRSRWRLLGSILSTLLTLALLVVVGLHLWQRMSPLEIRSVRVAVAEPPGDRCDVTVDVVATVDTNGRAGRITYQWLRGGAEPGGLLTERVARGQRTVTLHLKWTFNGVGSTTESAVINITEPTPTQGRTIFRYQCEAG